MTPFVKADPVQREKHIEQGCLLRLGLQTCDDSLSLSITEVTVNTTIPPYYIETTAHEDTKTATTNEIHNFCGLMISDMVGYGMVQ
eukprot:scaffold5897_cov141-Amphora_coffeaeformis.AAC.2